ncbi:MAG: choice-of-anchor D domain-containing protein [Dehalococcoidia bacterium]
MRKILKLRILSSLVLAAALIALMVVPVLAQPPVTSPISGSVTIGGVNAPVGTTVGVFVGTETTARTSVTTTIAGHYEVVVNGTGADVGQALSFKVNGLAATSSPASPTFMNYQPQVVNLAVGTGGAVPDISVATSLAFGSATVGTSKTKTLTISNVGTAALTITNIGVSGSQFSVGSYPGTIAAGSSANVIITFSPTSTGSKSATLTIVSNDPDEASVPVALSGTGSTAALPWPGTFAGWLYETFIAS